MTTTHERDWRTRYIVCEHVAEDGMATAHASYFRACCLSCRTAGFLQAHTPLRTERTESGLVVGRIEEDEKR